MQTVFGGKAGLANKKIWSLAQYARTTSSEISQ